MSKKLSRRDFVKLTGMASAAIPFTMSGFPLYGTNNKMGAALDESNDKILVLIQLQGGNDGLATLFDANQYANLNAVRSNVLVPENNIINLYNDYGLHPSCQGIKDIWNMGSLGIVQNVGYPNQNRSHFRSTDIWNSASAAEISEPRGWIGRFYDLNYSDYPNGYPNSEKPHPFALTMGKIVSETCQGVNSNYSLSLLDPFNPGTALVSAEGDIPANCFGDKLNFVNDTVSQTNAYASVIKDAANAGNNISSKWNSLETELSAKLKNVARLISGGLQTKIYIVELGGFDTHDNQVVAGETTTGLHSELLKELSDAACAFQDDLVKLGIDERVISMTYSEFGRRIRSNDALGTDHGTAAPLFLFGSCIENQILGDHPEIDTQVGIDEGVPIQFDFKNVYGTILSQWLGASEDEVKTIISPDFQALPILKSGCEQTTGINQNYYEVDLHVYPNPTKKKLNVTFTSKANEQVKITVFNTMGGVVLQKSMQKYTQGNNQIELSLNGLRPGSYFVHFQTAQSSKIEKVIKL